MSETVIKIEDLKKKYVLGTIGGHTLTGDLNAWWAKVRGKENPNSKIGEDTGKFGQKFYALDGINLEIKKGEAVGIIGTNGAGKSTLLKILSRVTVPSEGAVYMNGRVTSMLEVGTGFHPELTGRENIYMNGAILGMTKEEIDSKIEEIIDFSECRQFIDTPVKRYSSGMYVKLAFSVAAHLDSEIMIMDEVLAVGDVKFQQKCLKKMEKEAYNNGKSILYVSHNMATIKQLCDRCIVLKKGKIVYDGDVDEAINIYLDRNENETTSKVELSSVERQSTKYGKKCFVKSFEFKNSNDGKFEIESVAECKITWDLFDNLSGFQLHTVILDEDFKPVGTMQSRVLDFIQEKNKNGIEFKMDLSNLCVGKYAFMLNLLHVNEYGGVESYDEPNKYIQFEIIEKKDSYKITWDKSKMGNVKLSPIQLL